MCEPLSDSFLFPVITHAHTLMTSSPSASSPTTMRVCEDETKLPENSVKKSAFSSFFNVFLFTHSHVAAAAAVVAAALALAVLALVAAAPPPGSLAAAQRGAQG